MLFIDVNICSDLFMMAFFLKDIFFCIILFLLEGYPSQDNHLIFEEDPIRVFLYSLF
jgi:hypothetical protein